MSSATASFAVSSGTPRPNEGAPLIIVSNRGPFEHYFDEGGRIRRRDAGGGVAVALGSVARSQRVSWLAAASSFADRLVSLMDEEVSWSNGSRLKMLLLPPEAYEPFYESFCNPLLWFVQHGIGADLRPDTVADATRSWQTGYRPINRLFADAVIAELDRHGGPGRVMLHDYHFYLAPRLVRRARPQAVIQHFVHIPWPAPEHWRTLPDGIVRELCLGLLGSDSIAFQTESCLENFVETCRVYAGDEVVIADRDHEITCAGHTTALWSNPIAPDVQELRDLAAAPEVLRYRRAFEAVSAARKIVRVDRLDPSKNVLRGFQAYELMLARNPALHGRVSFLAFLVPSRGGIPEYDAYAAAVMRLIDEINARYGTGSWQPVVTYCEQNRAQALAGLSLYDVLLVNSVADGMNLVSKEGPVVNQVNGAVVLSRTAGSYRELQAGALGVDPLDVPGTAAALEAALLMSPEERRSRAEALRAAVQRHQLGDWLRHQLKDLELAEHVKRVTAA